jgi:hypothetical protein
VHQAGAQLIKRLVGWCCPVGLMRVVPSSFVNPTHAGPVYRRGRLPSALCMVTRSVQSVQRFQAPQHSIVYIPDVHM